ncbi:MAG: PLDc N-terminal domain-containing protein [Actinomycetota bacterium]
MLAYDYPLLGLFWTMVFVAFWVSVLYLLFRVFADILRNPDMGGLAKVLWIVFVILVPVVGIIAYVIVRERALSEREYSAARGSPSRW